MNEVLRINAEDLTATVQPGVTRKQLNEAVKHTGLFFPIDPGADASLGGMAATRASGTNAVRYGTMRENVLALEVVTASGEVIRTGTRAKKSSAGYDLTRLFVGSEGTLGVITEVTLRLYPLPEAISAAICHFPSVAAAVDTTIEIIQMGVPIARVELLDANAVRAVNRHDKLALRETPMLLMEFHGSDAGVKEQATTGAGYCTRTRRRGVPMGEHARGALAPVVGAPSRLLRRHGVQPGLPHRHHRRLRADLAAWPKRSAESVREADASGLPYYIVGHVGDGNYHVAYLIDPKNATQWNTAEQLNEQLVQRALRLEGTCTGEHGVGLHKQGFLIDETGVGAVDVMRTLKRALDPKEHPQPGQDLLAVTPRVGAQSPVAGVRRIADAVRRLGDYSVALQPAACTGRHGADDRFLCAPRSAGARGSTPLRWPSPRCWRNRSSHGRKPCRFGSRKDRDHASRPAAAADLRAAATAEPSCSRDRLAI